MRPRSCPGKGDFPARRLITENRWTGCEFVSQPRRWRAQGPRPGQRGAEAASEQAVEAVASGSTRLDPLNGRAKRAVCVFRFPLSVFNFHLPSIVLLVIA